MISVERSFFEKFPRLAAGRARSFSQPVVELLRKIACEERINRVLADLAPLTGFDFVERALEKFGVSYRIAHTDRENIPAEGRIVIVANHPLGAFDALALVHLVGGVRRDVRILANDVLSQLAQLSSLLLPVNVFGSGASAGRLRDAYRALENEQALIVFPAGEVSRMGPQGVRDGRWSSGFVRMARHAGASVLPVHIAAHNSPTFYGVSMLAKPLSSLLLPREMFVPQQLGISVGEPVAASELGTDQAEPVAQAMRRHVYELAKRRPTVFVTSRTIAHPESPLAIRHALKRAQELGATQDGKRILLIDAQPDCPVLREIGRLRELSFRRVGEGSGLRRDLDRFDTHYRHLVLWDEQALAIVGAYRLGEGARILAAQGLPGLYSSTLFDYAPPAREFIAEGVELGRSFVQPAYWNSRSLDYLWQGIGAYLRHRPDLRYLFGPVSISAALPPAAREWIVHCHRHYFGDGEGLAASRNPLKISPHVEAAAAHAWADKDAKAGLIQLKRQLAQMECAIPTLYKHYVDLCEPEGVRFLAFGTDPAFGHCVDGLIRLDLNFLRAAKRQRYLEAA
ncbi:lysophospholipid acyltransferase family protein [Rudaea cellulosilytica]|uniref:lysophospholipid acyltransferase family protein n=1 Tax=Rudaea cellulosilytica TaxID=540746 RepID=UPI000369B048|nr:lysophospholipid acyltransferase family protein [Rudaea cellulosilytica]